MPASYYLIEITNENGDQVITHLSKIEAHFALHISPKTVSEYLRTLRYLLLVTLTPEPPPRHTRAALRLTLERACERFEQMSTEEANALLSRLAATLDDPKAWQALSARWGEFGLAPSYLEKGFISATLGLLRRA